MVLKVVGFQQQLTTSRQDFYYKFKSLQRQILKLPFLSFTKLQFVEKLIRLVHFGYFS